MKPELKKKWIEALRSGKYKQTRQTLHDGGGYCCLGVLCEISGVGHFGNCNEFFYTKELDDGGHDCDVGEETYVESELDHELQDRFGVSNDEMFELIAMNDGRYNRENEADNRREHTFTEIADWIEENL